LCFQPSSGMVSQVWGMTNIEEGLEGVCYIYITIFIKDIYPSKRILIFCEVSEYSHIRLEVGLLYCITGYVKISKFRFQDSVLACCLLQIMIPCSWTKLMKPEAMLCW
jgi:hypothetical protein